MASPPPIRHNEEEHRFEAETDDGTAMLEYSPFKGGVTFTHTRVPEGARGEGVAMAMAREALEWARAEGLRVVPVCAFVVAYLRRHPEYAELTAPAKK